jgi:zinc/manganese transport system substrate-binding protein
MSAHVLRRTVGVGLLLSLALLTACSSSAAGDGSGKVSVVASTNVWGDVVKQIAGDKVKITSIITDPAQDPHSYEADPQNQLAIAKADIVIENGGGYDDFVDSMLKTAGGSAVVLNAVTISGKVAPAGGGLNEHVWYDFPTVEKVAARLVDALTRADPAEKATFTANAKTFVGRLKTLEADETQIKSADAGDGAAITEPVPLYMLEACGLVNKTPSQFSEAVEEGTGVPATILKQTLDLFSNKQVKVLAYNQQTSGPETEKVLSAAKSNDVAVVPVTETLPDGQNYLSWMTANVNAIKAALS